MITEIVLCPFSVTVKKCWKRKPEIQEFTATKITVMMMTFLSYITRDSQFRLFNIMLHCSVTQKLMRTGLLEK